MKNDIILAGVGGQGILSIAAAIGHAAVSSNLNIKQAEVHGMSQRGGDVQSHLRISDAPIASDLVPEGGADMIISVEPMEALRYLPMLSPNGWVVTSTTPFINIPDYPQPEEVLAEVNKIKNHVAIDAEEIAKQIGSPRVSNMVMLGAASLFLDIPFEKIEEGIRDLFGRKGNDIVEVNLKALRAGREYSEKHK